MTKSKWNQQPGTDEWNTASNWTPAEIPGDSAVFGASSQTTIAFSKSSEASVGSIEFESGAPSYIFRLGTAAKPALTISGQGVSNHSGTLQSFMIAATSSGYKNPQLQFTNSANAGAENMYYCAGPETEQGSGGGVICFHDTAKAGSASFKAWTGAAAPPEHSTVGGEISFCDSSSADNASFAIYGTLGTDGDTFGNVVFHDQATAANASFNNVGGTVSGGDGGNTQFYGQSTAANGLFNNGGGTHAKANGGDVAFDATATGAQGRFYNHAAKASGAYGGVTSFNNNPPSMTANEGASAGSGSYFNYGASGDEQGGGGHLEFSARYGSPTAANAFIVNHGSSLASKSTAGHTIFSINLPSKYHPTAGNATIWNHPAEVQKGAAGYTEFSVYQRDKGTEVSVYSSDDSKAHTTGSYTHVPTAGDATILNLGANVSDAPGGYTVFSGTSDAGNATLIAHSGTQGGDGGRIAFYDQSSGGAAKVYLYGNGELDIGDHTGALTIAALELTGGIIAVQLGKVVTGLTVSGKLKIYSSQVIFSFWKKEGNGFAFNTPYTILVNENLSDYSSAQFSGNSIDGVEPTFTIVGNQLQVSFLQN